MTDEQYQEQKQFLSRPYMKCSEKNVSHCLMECAQSFNQTDGLFVQSKLS